MIKQLTLLLPFVLFCCFTSFGQDTKMNVSGDFNDLTIAQFVKELELKIPVKFYYNEEEVKQVSITIKVINRPLDQLLESVLAKTDIKYAIYEHTVFLTKGVAVVTTLSPVFSGMTQKDIIPGKPVLKADPSIPEAAVASKLYEIGQRAGQTGNGKVLLSGYVKNIRTGEAVAGATVTAANGTATATNDAGYYSILLLPGKNNLVIKSQGMQEARRQLMVYTEGKINFSLQEQTHSLQEVNISAEKVRNVKAVELGVNRLDIKSIKQVPVVFGEADVLRVVLTLPGVKSVGESSTGFNVRGGSTDQNLILLNEVTVFSPAHFFGFFSAFNPEIVKDIELYKSSIPQKYGGRLSSVLEVTNREGNKEKFTGSAGIGLLTSRLNIEGPIDSGKTSFIFGGRTTYANWLLNLLPEEYKNSRASFYDLNLDVNHKIDDKNALLVSTYLSKDKFKLNSGTTYKYANSSASLRWKHIFNSSLYASFLGDYSGYNYNVEATANPVNAYNLFFGIKQVNAKADFTYILNEKHNLDFGLNSTYYNLSPGQYKGLGNASLVENILLEQEKAVETAVYLGDRFEVSPKLSVNFGLRYSLYNYLGARSINTYAAGLPVEVSNQTGTTNYGSGKIIKTYSSPEVRFSFRYTLAENLAVKGGFNTLTQYIHLLSNSTSISPTDIWKLSDPNIKPQKGNQISIGLYKNNRSNSIELSAEAYYKKLSDFLDYKSGATLVLNPHIETDVVRTKGKAYGAEFMLKKVTGSLNGWISYTYSRTFLQMNDASQGDLINGGAFYAGNADKPHDFNFTGNYRFTHRYSMSVNVAYSTGRPITLPIAKYEYGGSVRVLYSDRNQYRIPDYFRSDLSFNIEGNHKVKQLTHNSWTVGVYNLTGRQNAYSTYFTTEGGAINGYKLSIFATAIPFINYNIRF